MRFHDIQVLEAYKRVKSEFMVQVELMVFNFEEFEKDLKKQPIQAMETGCHHQELLSESS
ncbi:hypothetical protein [Acetivibrio clariflavus]|uniref:hypothetical protein n=1 Tax=Acetivibrio clariflavus TaxID=288965 RepID=UPI0004864B3A|nr:hypothetical protein [Acetivibrio clariflavus]